MTNGSDADANANATLSAIKVEVTPIAAASCPVLPTKTCTADIGGQATTVISQAFSDRIFLSITQLGKFGCLYQATTSTNPASSLDPDTESEAPTRSGSGSTLPPPLPTTSVSKLVGTEPTPAHSTLYQLYVAQIASIVKHQAVSDPRPLIVSLALKTSPLANADSAAGKETTMDSTLEHNGWDDEQDALLVASEQERQRFMAVMELVQKCRVW